MLNLGKNPVMRVYLDNNLIQLVASLIKKKYPEGNPNLLMEMAALNLLSNIKSIYVDFLVSEESLAEIRNLSEGKPKRTELEDLYFKLKQGKSVIRNSSVVYDDPIATWDSPDVFWDHKYDDTDLNKVRTFLSSKGNTNDFDARYIANSMLKENYIDYFLTSDKKSIWNYKDEIEKLFGVKVRLPTELAETLKHVR